MKPIRKTQLLEQYQNIGLSLVSFSEDYELDLKFNEKNEKTSDNATNKTEKYFCKLILVIEEEWFSDTNLTDDDTFPPALIKRSKTIINQKINFPHDTK